ncbi:MAG: EF2563 family selenium-dependent molybdenum hydroxylase system protein [Desulfomonile tiedjei]|nr:EF2563 family selenium-dependent molybdenum hydroxylase system protein [Desulfomonile tiedjei]
MPVKFSDLKIIVRGAGEMATGTACRLHRSGFFRLLMTEIEHPLTVRRTVSFSEAVYAGTWTVEGVQSIRIAEPAGACAAWDRRMIPVIVDADNRSKDVLRPDVIVDAILAKRNLGTTLGCAPLVIGLGPGFHAGRDVHFVVETNRGHNLGRVISEGTAAADTGIPGVVMGETIRRVLRAPKDGVFESGVSIGRTVEIDQIVGHVGAEPVRAQVTGMLRGLIRPGTFVQEGMKIGDVDPRGEIAYCQTVSEKARALGGAVLEAILRHFNT